MSFTGWIQFHRRSILFLIVVFAISGVFEALSIPVGLFPSVSFPRIVINIDAGDRPAERMIIEVTLPVEEAVRSVPAVREIRSTTSRGSAEVSVNFEWGNDMVAAALQVESAVNHIISTLPSGTTFDVRRMNPTVFPVLGYSLTSDANSLVELRDMALYQIRPVLSAVQGVSRIGVLGGATAEYHVMADPARLDSFGLDMNDVSKALSAANVVTAVGRLEEDYKLYLVMSDTQFTDFDQLGQTILRSGANGLVLLEDVAIITKSTSPQWTRATADGHDAVIFQIYQQPGGNTVKIGREVSSQLEALKNRLPSSVHIANWYDQSDLILASAASVRDAVIIGILLASFILFLFLYNIRITVVSVLTLPLVLAATILVLGILHRSFNIMTLGGMAAAVGLILDDAIVTIEHIMRRISSGQGHYRDRVTSAASEFTRPLSGSSLSTIIIFAPLAFLAGVTGAFFKALSLTMAASLVVSFFVAWLAVPLLAQHMLRQEDAEKESAVQSHWAHRQYKNIMQRILRRPFLILLLLLPFLGAGWLAYQRVGTGFMPPMDEGGFILDYVAPPGTSLTETDRLVRKVEAILQQTPEVQTYSRRTGLQLGGGLTEANQGDFFVRLKPPPRRGIESVMDDVRKQILHSVPGLQVELTQLMEDLIGDLTAVPQPIEIKLFSDKEQQLRDLAQKVAQAIAEVPGVVDIKNGIVLAGDALDIRVDRDKAALQGVEPATVTTILNAYLTGLVTTQIQKGPKMVSVRVWIPQDKRDTIGLMRRLRLRAPDGHLFPLASVASIQRVTGQPQITRDNLKRMVAVTGRISGRDMGSTVTQVQNVLDNQGFLPKDVYYTLGGLYRQQRIAFSGLIKVFAAAAVLVFLLLLFMYERFRVAGAILATTLMSMAAVFIGLWLTHTELNITAIMGMTMILGIVTEVMIFYYSEYDELQSVKDRGDRFIRAGLNRMRPIAMTTLATILALMPLALGLGQGSAMLQPLAIAIISGLVVQIPLVLGVLPALLSILGESARQ